VSEKFKEKWKIVRDEDVPFIEDDVVIIINTNEIVRVSIKNELSLAEYESEALYDHIVDTHNACQGLARVDKIPLLIQNCESLLPLIQESHPTYYANLKATIAQIKGVK